MGKTSPYGVGGLAASRGVTSVSGRIVVAAGGAPAASWPLQTEGLPYISVWCQQVSPVGVGLGATITLQGSVRPLGLATGVTKADQAEYKKLTAWIMPAGGGELTPLSPLALEFPVSKVRLHLGASEAAVVDTVFDFIIYANG